MRTLAMDQEFARRQAQRASEVVAAMTWERQKETYYDVIDRMVARRRGD
jgi:hypothetical protein